MIRFRCKSCGQKLKVEDAHSGKSVKCPKCGIAGVVPDNSDKIKFHCENCGQKISVPQIHAGRKGKCPNCGSYAEVPTGEDYAAQSHEQKLAVGVAGQAATEESGRQVVSSSGLVTCPSCNKQLADDAIREDFLFRPFRA